MQKIGRTIRRRRREAKTDYKARLGALKSGKIRFVIRRTNRYILGQAIESNMAQDKVLSGVTSKDLLDYGWPENLKGSLKSIVASYLSGVLLAKKSKINEGILDIGLQRKVVKSKIFAFLKGLVDAGVKIPHDAKSLPDKALLERNEKTAKLINQVMEAIKNGK